MNVLFVGFGSVAKSVVVLWNSIMPTPLINAIVVDPMDSLDLDDSRIIHYSLALTQDNYSMVLSDLTRNHSTHIIVDLSVYVEGLSMIEWCQANNILYCNTSLEEWESRGKWTGQLDDLYSHTLYSSQLNIRKTYTNPESATCCVDMGANPGVISHMALKCLRYVAGIKGVDPNTHPADLAEMLGLEVVHISERDTQKPSVPMPAGTFCNTWSSIGLVEEAITPSQLGWGTHESCLPEDAVLIEEPFPGSSASHQIFLTTRSMDVKVRSYEPRGGEFVGMCISHSEASTLAHYLSNDYYLPSVYYVYRLSDMALEGLAQVKANGYEMLDSYYIYPNKYIAEGYDALGALCMFRQADGSIECYWSGSIVDDSDVKKVHPEINATSIQVTAGVFAAVDFCMNHPWAGVRFSEGLNTDRVFQLATGALASNTTEHRVNLPNGGLLGNVVCDRVPYHPGSTNFCDLRVL